MASTLSQMTGSITYSDTKATNAPSLNLPIGTENTSDAVREIIQMPPDGESMYSDMGQQRYYNKAEMLILVDDSGITAPRSKIPLMRPAHHSHRAIGCISLHRSGVHGSTRRQGGVGHRD